MPTPPSRLLRIAPALSLAALALAVAAVAAGLGFVWVSYDRMGQLETQLARRIGEFDTASREARAAAKAANEALADLQNRLMALENRGRETQDQQLALTAMYQDLARSQDERIAADIEQTLLLAQQQLLLAGNVRAALIGLEAAETRLAQLARPQFVALRTAIVQDMERLKLLPAADIESLGARLDVLIQGVADLRTEMDSEATPRPMPPVELDAGDHLARLSGEIWREFKSLVRIRRLDQPDPALLSPTQAYFLRENLKLRLLAARLALLQRDETAYRADLGAARDWVRRYFSLRDAAGKAYVASLEDLLKAPVALKDAGLDASLRALRASRKGP